MQLTQQRLGFHGKYTTMNNISLLLLLKRSTIIIITTVNLVMQMEFVISTWRLLFLFFFRSSKLNTFFFN